MAINGVNGPIRVGLIGLSSKAKTSWGAIAHLPYLHQAAKDGKFKIVALLNSSQDAARSAIEAFDLDPSVAAYGDAGEFARDDGIDLVVCLTRVDLHWATVEPSIRAKKAIFVEWPLAKDFEQAQKSFQAAQDAGTLNKTVVGLQGRLDPSAALVSKLIRDGRLGKVHSADQYGTVGYFGPRMSESVGYFNDPAVGGNLISIYLGHRIDMLLTALDAELQSVSAILTTGHKSVQLVDGSFFQLDDYGKSDVVREVSRETPDQISVHGILRSKTPKSSIAEGAVLALRLRGDLPFKDDDTAGTLWRIYGEKGEIRVKSTSFDSSVGLRGPEISVDLFTTATGEVEHFEVQEQDLYLAKLPPPAQNIGRLYELFRTGGSGYASFADALERHRLLDAVERSSRERRFVDL